MTGGVHLSGRINIDEDDSIFLPLRMNLRTQNASDSSVFYCFCCLCFLCVCVCGFFFWHQLLSNVFTIPSSIGPWTPTCKSLKGGCAAFRDLIAIFFFPVLCCLSFLLPTSKNKVGRRKRENKIKCCFLQHSIIFPLGRKSYLVS